MIHAHDKIDSGVLEIKTIETILTLTTVRTKNEIKLRKFARFI